MEASKLKLVLTLFGFAVSGFLAIERLAPPVQHDISDPAYRSAVTLDIVIKSLETRQGDFGDIPLGQATSSFSHLLDEASLNRLKEIDAYSEELDAIIFSDLRVLYLRLTDSAFELVIEKEVCYQGTID